MQKMASGLLLVYATQREPHLLAKFPGDPRMQTSTFLARVMLAVIVLLIPLAASAQTSLGYQVLVDADADAATGCPSVPTDGLALPGFEHRLLITVEVGAGSATVTSLEQQDCSESGFAAPFAVTAPASPPWPAGLDAGTGGADAVEAAVLRQAVVAPFSPRIRLAFVADDGVGSDVLITTDGSADGEAILLGLPMDPYQIPVFSLAGLALLLLAVVVLGWLAQRRLGRIAAMSMLLLVGGLAWAMNFLLDGDLADWDGLAPTGQDAAGDATDGSSGNDLVAGFAVFENEALYFRIDVVDMENRAPVAEPDAYVTDEDTSLAVAPSGVLGNDSDPDNDPITALLDAGPANGQSFTLNPDGSFDFTPAGDFNGSDSFTYFVNDGQADSASTTVTITVNAINDPPVAVDDAATTDEDQPVDIDVLNNDSDLDGNLDPSTVSVTVAPSDGVTTVDSATGVIRYAGSLDFNGSDSFVYEVCDDGTPAPVECVTATVTITIDPVDDPPSAGAWVNSGSNTATSPGYQLRFSFGQGTQNQNTMSSSSYRLRGGLVPITE